MRANLSPPSRSPTRHIIVLVFRMVHREVEEAGEGHTAHRWQKGSGAQECGPLWPLSPRPGGPGSRVLTPTSHAPPVPALGNQHGDSLRASRETDTEEYRFHPREVQDEADESASSGWWLPPGVPGGLGTSSFLTWVPGTPTSLACGHLPSCARMICALLCGTCQQRLFPQNGLMT